MRIKSLRLTLSSFLVTILLIACTQSKPLPQVSQQPTVKSSTLLISAASSLEEALQEITPIYTQANPNQTINYNLAASGTLQQQIEQGAPADVFISAANKQMDALENKELLASGTRKNLLTNQLVLVIPKQAAVSLTDFQQLVKPEVKRIAVGEPRSVPVGEYAAEVLQNIGILEQVQAKFVLGSNVKSVLTAVETGDVDAGIIYITDAQSSDKVTIVATAAEGLHSPIRYPIAVLNSSKFLDAAKQYVDFLQSPPAKAVFEKYGFGILKS